MFWIIAFLFILFIRPQDWPGNPIYGWPVYYIVMIGALALILVKKKIELKELKTPVNYLLAAFLALAFISNMLNGDIAAGIEQVITFGKRIIVYFIFIILLDSPKKIRQTLFYSMIFTAILGLQGIYQSTHGVGWADQVLHSIGGGGVIHYNDILRTFWIGLWDGPNVLCLAYLMAVAFCLNSLFDGAKPFLAKIIYLVSLSLLCYGIYLTNSRGGFMALGLIILIFIFMRFKIKRAVFVLLLCAPVFLMLQPSRMSELNSQEESAHERTWVWEQGLNVFMANKIIGVGKGQFSRNNDIGLAAHNNTLAAVAETGIIGGIIYFALFYFSVKGALIVYRDRLRSNVNDDLFNLSIAIVPAIMGFYFATFFVLMEHDILFIYFALCTSIYLIARRHNSALVLKASVKDWIYITLSVAGIIHFIRLIAEGKIFAS